MTSSTGFSGKRHDRTRRVTHFTDFFEDWMLELVLVAGVAAAAIQCVLSLNGGTLG
jgi:hypothetical protein